MRMRWEIAGERTSPLVAKRESGYREVWCKPELVASLVAGERRIAFLSESL